MLLIETFDCAEKLSRCSLNSKKQVCSVVLYINSMENVAIRGSPKSENPHITDAAYGYFTALLVLP